MTSIPLTDCCTLLGIDPKTLRTWLRHANMAFAAHPRDARLKCLTKEQVQQLARLHDRPLSPSPLAQPAPQKEANPGISAEASVLVSQVPAASLSPATVLPPSHSEEGDLRQSLARLEQKVTTMQEQLLQLALQLLQERERSVEQRLSALETLLRQEVRLCPSSPVSELITQGSQLEVKEHPERRLVPAELRARSRVTPLIEYGAHGNYVAVCPQEGVLSLQPDSPEWFEWLASLTSFRFVGPAGRFTAYRDSEHGQRTRSWTAHRCFHAHHYHHYLGVTDRLTLARLEQMAAKLSAHFTML